MNYTVLSNFSRTILFSKKLIFLRLNAPKYFKRYEVRNPLTNNLGCVNYYSILIKRSDVNSYQYRLSAFSQFPACHFHFQRLFYKENVGDKPENKDQEKDSKSPSKSDFAFGENLSLFQKFKLMYTRYWYVAIPVHGVTSIFWFGGFFFAAKSGVDINPFLEKLGVSLPYLRDSDLGYYGIAYAMYKIASPARYTVTLGGTTFAINYLRNRGYIKPVPTKKELKVMYEDKREELKEKGEEMREKYHEKKDEMKEIYQEKVDGLREKYQDKADEMKCKYKERRKRLLGRYGLRKRKDNGNNNNNNNNNNNHKRR